MSKSELIKAIDAQDTRVIQAYLQAHQELDCNALTPNGLSALWVALNPPLGKPISRDVVRFLLNYVKNNGEPLINPTQEYNGYTASQYLESFKDYTIQQGYFANAGEYSNLFYLVRYTENNYIHPQRADQGAQNLGGLAADAQNVHDSFVSKLAKSNLARLYQHYVLEQDKKLDNAAISSCRGTLKIAIGRLKKDKTHQEKAVQMEQGLAFCKNNTSRFTLELESKQEVSMTLSEVLALLGHAIEEKDDSLLILPEKEKDNNPKEEARQARIQGVLGILYDNATAYYGLNRASCEGGAFNRFGFALAALHHLVKNQSDEPLTGEVARMEMSQFFKKLLETLIQENIPLYWKVVRAQLLNNPTDKEDTEAYEQFVSDHMNEWTKTLIEEHHIEEQEARNFTSVIEEAYPYHQHELTRNLLLLLPLISATKEGIKLLAQLKENYPAADALNGVLALCAGTLAQQPQ